MLRHGFDERGFGEGRGLVLFAEGGEERVEIGLRFIGEDAEGSGKPWRVLFKAEMAFPASLFGPEDNFAFSRLASSCDSVDILRMLLRTRVSLTGVRSQAPGVGRVFRARAIEFFFYCFVNGPPALWGPTTRNENGGQKG